MVQKAFKEFASQNAPQKIGRFAKDRSEKTVSSQAPAGERPQRKKPCVRFPPLGGNQNAGLVFLTMACFCYLL
jgi:hypothetical protein